MEIVLGKTAGFCNGVLRAVEETKKVIQKNSNIYCLGDLVHNEQVILDLKLKGLKVINSINEAPNYSTVIIRAHGVEKKVYQKAKEKNITLVDLTCVKVLQIHKQVEEYANNGYYIFLIAEEKHPETVGTISFCGNNSHIIQEKSDILKGIKKLKRSKKQKLLVISQTTFSLTKFENMINEIVKFLDENVKLEIKNTICNATNKRQKETEDLSKQVECMIVIGGSRSSNTKKLFEIANQNCKKAIFIHNESDLNLKEINIYKKVGVMAGASTPRKSIEEVIKKLEGEKVCI